MTKPAMHGSHNQKLDFPLTAIDKITLSREDESPGGHQSILVSFF
jgi:hypothetical protein